MADISNTTASEMNNRNHTWRLDGSTTSYTKRPSSRGSMFSRSGTPRMTASRMGVIASHSSR